MITFSKEIRLLSQPLAECPEGVILDEHHPDPAVDRFFEGYANPLGMSHNHPSLLEVVTEGGEKVIRHRLGYPGLFPHRYGVDRFMLGGEDEMRDYLAAADVAMDHFSSTDNADNSTCVSAMAGVFARFRNNREYYFFGIEGTGVRGRAVLYCRVQDEYRVLASRPLYVKLGQYYHLELIVKGADLYGYLDGECVAQAVDSTYVAGKAGFRFTTAGRARRFEVWMEEGDYEAFSQEVEARKAMARREEARYPECRLVASADLSQYAPFDYKVVDLPSGDIGFLICGKTCTALADHSGRVLWESPIVGDFQHVTGVVGGTFDIAGICKAEGKVAVLDGLTGQCRAMIDCPTDQTPSLIPRYRYAGWEPMPANVRGLPMARDIVVRSSASPAATGSELYLYDENLNLLWHRDRIFPPYGHQSSLAFYDMDGSGRDTVFAGCTRLSPDGEIVWYAKARKFIEDIVDGMHVDSCLVANYTGKPILYCAASSAGFIMIDTETGETISQTAVGHAQQIFSGAYFGDGKPYLAVFTRWGNYGIIYIFDPRGRKVASFQLDHVSEGGYSVNWTGDGQELICLCAGTPEMGLYDGFGRRVVRFPEEVMKGLPWRNGRNFLQVYARPVGTQDPRDHLFMNLNGVICEYAPAEEYDPARHRYRPVRRLYASDPGWDKERGEQPV
ncbi:MAG: hypothetical protein IJM90_00695 [Firmicutes bacterium]|nr:hypothetical protein [Bacillota bacterium]